MNPIYLPSTAQLGSECRPFSVSTVQIESIFNVCPPSPPSWRHTSPHVPQRRSSSKHAWLCTATRPAKSIHPSISLAICYPRGRGGRAAVGLYKIRLRENSSGFHSPLVVLSAVFSSRCHFPRRVMSTAVSSLRSFESHSSPSKIIQLSRFSPFSWKHATLLIAINLYSPQVTWREQLRRHSVVKVTSDNRARQSWSRIG